MLRLINSVDPACGTFQGKSSGLGGSAHRRIARACSCGGKRNRLCRKLIKVAPLEGGVLIMGIYQYGIGLGEICVLKVGSDVALGNLHSACSFPTSMRLTPELLLRVIGLRLCN